MVIRVMLEGKGIREISIGDIDGLISVFRALFVIRAIGTPQWIPRRSGNDAKQRGCQVEVMPSSGVVL